MNETTIAIKLTSSNPQDLDNAIKTILEFAELACEHNGVSFNPVVDDIDNAWAEAHAKRIFAKLKKEFPKSALKGPYKNPLC